MRIYRDEAEATQLPLVRKGYVFEQGGDEPPFVLEQ